MHRIKAVDTMLAWSIKLLTNRVSIESNLSDSEVLSSCQNLCGTGIEPFHSFCKRNTKTQTNYSISLTLSIKSNKFVQLKKMPQERVMGGF